MSWDLSACIRMPSLKANHLGHSLYASWSASHKMRPDPCFHFPPPRRVLARPAQTSRIFSELILGGILYATYFTEQVITAFAFASSRLCCSSFQFFGDGMKKLVKLACESASTTSTRCPLAASELYDLQEKDATISVRSHYCA